MGFSLCQKVNTFSYNNNKGSFLHQRFNRNEENGQNYNAPISLATRQ